MWYNTSNNILFQAPQQHYSSNTRFVCDIVLIVNGTLTSPGLVAADVPTARFDDDAAGSGGVCLQVPDLSAAGVASLSDEELDGLLAGVGGVRSRLAGFEGRLLVEVERRGRWASGVLTQTQQVGSRWAKRRAKVANRLFGRASTDDVGLVRVVAALEEARITEAHSELIALQAGNYRAAVDEQQELLVSQASEFAFDEFVVWLGGWRADVDRAAGRSPADRQKKDRKASGGTRADDGMYLFTAAHTPIVGAAISKQIAIVDQVLWRLDSKLPKRKRRTPAQRRADAHEWLVMRPVRSEKLRLPTDEDAAMEAALARADVTIMVIATVDDLQAGRGELVDGTVVDLDDLIKQAAHVSLVPAVFDSSGVNLWQGRKHRIPTEPLRQAVIARDRHCTFEGCTVPAEWCQIHHIIWWSRGGTTDPPNLCLLCSEHHHFVHDLGWELERQPNGSLTWTPSANRTQRDRQTSDPQGRRSERPSSRTTRASVVPPNRGQRDGASIHNLIRKQPTAANSDEDAAASEPPAA